MESMGERIKRLRLERGLTQEELGNKFGLKRAAINKYEKGNVENMKRSTIEEMSRFFEVSPSYLMALDETSSIEAIFNQLTPPRQKNVLYYAEEQLKAQNGKLVPFPNKEPQEELVPTESYGAVSAGTGEFLFGVERAETVYLPKDDLPDEPFDYVLKINGDSMLPTYEDGEYIYVKSFSNGGHVRSGMLAIVMYDNEVYFKKLYFDNSGVRLVSLNKEYEDIIITDPGCFQVLGKVVS